MAGPLPEGVPWPQDNVLVAQSKNDATFHAYVHIPFCEVRCGYCDFNTYTNSELGGVTRTNFHESLLREIAHSSVVTKKSGFPAREFSTVFFGGGTPSLMSPAQISLILEALRTAHGIAQGAEITLEANPETLSREYLQEIFDAGINRLSMGAQSFDQAVLNVLDRAHSPAKVLEFAPIARQIGFRTSIDLIYGAPGESLDSWRTTLETAIALETEHVSAYSLIVEPGTKLARQISSGKLAEVDEDLNAEKYEMASALFRDCGLDWYEVSNWGAPSDHNLAYWRSMDWWGFGPGAHSHLSGNRFWNRKHPTAYADSLESGSPAAGMETLDERTRLEERLLLELRIKGGVERQLLQSLDIKPALVAQAIADGLLEPLPGNRIAVTEAGRLLVDGLVVDFLSK